jgi:hypothetical protein
MKRSLRDEIILLSTIGTRTSAAANCHLPKTLCGSKEILEDVKATSQAAETALRKMPKARLRCE